MTVGMWIALIAVCVSLLTAAGSLIWVGLRLAFYAGEIHTQLAQHEIRITNLENKMERD